MSPLKKLLRRSLWGLLYLLPAVLFFSYYPVISLGASSSMNLELSLPLIWLVLFDLVAFANLFTLAPRQPIPEKRPPRRPVPKNSPAQTATPKAKVLKNLPGISDRRIFLFSLFPFYLTLSVFWSRNPLRGLLTAGIAWLLFFAIFVIIYLLPLLQENSPSPQKPQTSTSLSKAPKSSKFQPTFQIAKNLKSHLLASLFLSTAAVCVFCFIQSVLDTCGFPRSETLLCAGCTYRSFGFPHPSGFAIEPQFMGNLLLAPTLTALYLLVFRPRLARAKDGFAKGSGATARTSATALQRQALATRLERRQTFALTLFALLFSTTLFFTFSRGAIYAYAVALLILFVFALIRRQFRLSLIVIPVATFLLSLSLQGTFAHFGPTSETFTSAVTKSIHQLSLGIIDLRSLAETPEDVKTPENTKTPEDANSSETSPVDQPPETVITDLDDILDDLNNHLKPDSELFNLTHDIEQETTYFEGYVAESTNIRLGLNEIALATVLQDPQTLIFGAGLGGAGVAMFEAFPEKVGSPKEIVQNETFSLLLETGLVGLFLAHFIIVLAFLAPLLPQKFIDGRAASPISPAELQGKNFFQREIYRLKTSGFWSHPALPLLAALIVAYLVTLQFFSGLPNALQIYLMPPFLFFVFRKPPSSQIAQKSTSEPSPSASVEPSKSPKIPENSCISCETAL